MLWNMSAKSNISILYLGSFDCLHLRVRYVYMVICILNNLRLNLGYFEYYILEILDSILFFDSMLMSFLVFNLLDWIQILKFRSWAADRCSRIAYVMVTIVVEFLHQTSGSFSLIHLFSISFSLSSYSCYMNSVLWIIRQKKTVSFLSFVAPHGIDFILPSA